MIEEKSYKAKENSALQLSLKHLRVLIPVPRNRENIMPAQFTRGRGEPPPPAAPGAGLARLRRPLNE